jgi:hypothetical protein
MGDFAGGRVVMRLSPSVGIVAGGSQALAVHRGDREGPADRAQGVHVVEAAHLLDQVARRCYAETGAITATYCLPRTWFNRRGFRHGWFYVDTQVVCRYW